MEEFGNRHHETGKTVSEKTGLSRSAQVLGETKQKQLNAPAVILQIIILLCLLYLFFSCAAEPSILDFKSAPLLGMIYDQSGRPVPAAGIILEDDSRQESDINGRFILPNLSKGKHQINIEKEGYEGLTIDISFSSRRQVLHIKLVSLDYLLSETEKAIAHNNLKKARGLIARIEAVEEEGGKNPYFLFLKAVLAYKKGAYAEARIIIMDLSERGFHNKAVFSFLTILNK